MSVTLGEWFSPQFQKPHVKLSNKKKDTDNRTYFFHVRSYDKNGHIRLNRGLTIAARIDGKVIKYTIARCGKNDHFCKRIGRMIAEGRLLKNKEVMHYPFNDIKAFAKAVFEIKP